MVAQVRRPFWLNRIQSAWERRRLVWLNGVRRVGKTTLARMFADAVYLNCDLPSVCRRLAEPELFYDSLPDESLVVFDEVHRLDDPSLLLKIGVDVYPQHRLLATGSSTLAATAKFRDSLTGRKESVYLPPVIWPECRDTFRITDLDRRLLHGGLPEALLAQRKAPEYFAEWMDSFFARDVQELFGIRNRAGFMKILQLLARNSGGLV
ncbi:MAG: AAA family ATPase, partial [Chitinivibrionales bacterium]|nr:AAA family ATPase [Chitinivibrionales bacterium]